jgi:hypothetical protein
MDSPRTGGEKPVMRRSGTLPSFPTVTVEKSKMGTQDINLPVSTDETCMVELALMSVQIDPKDWTSAWLLLLYMPSGAEFRSDGTRKIPRSHTEDRWARWSG